VPFKHKLSKRLALMRDAVFGLAAAVLACSPDQSISGPPRLLLTSSQPVCQQSAAVWLNSAFAPQTGSFTVQFDGTPNGAAIDGVIGLAAGAAGAYTDLAAIVRFNVAGQIDARNGGAYAAMTAIPYTAGTSYHFRLVVDVASRTYAAYVTPFGGAELPIGTGYAFRTEQSGATALANWASYTSSGTLTLCNFGLGSGIPSVSVVSVIVSPASVSVEAGWTGQLTATPEDAAGSALSGWVVTWASSAPAVATVSGSGLVTAVAAGAALITATSDGRSATSVLTVQPAPPPPGCNASSPAWLNTAFTAQTGSFTVQFDATPNGAAIDGITGLSLGATAAYTDLAVIVRFNVRGTIDARNGGAYGAATAIPYTAGTSYHFRLAVDIPTHIYAAYVTAPGGTEATIGTGLIFRSEQSTATSLANWALYSDAGNHAACNFSITSSAPPVPVASVTVSPASATVAAGGTGQLTATPKDATGTPLSGRVVTWSSSGNAVATVNDNGVVSGVVVGAATITATSEGQSGTTQVSVTASAPGQVIYYSTNFNDGTTGPLDVYAYGGGSCAASTAYVDPGSAHSMKCTIPAPGGAAALQTWFGTSKLVGTPNDPSLDQDLFEQVRFVLAPGAAAAIGGTTCGSSNSGSQFKTHKSVYGQSGSAINGWVMSEISPCSDGNIGMFSEAEMWRNNGHANPWPGTYPSLNEGTVYDVVYRYHRYTAQGCGTVAVWVNGTKVMDLACASYMGTTGGSSAGLLFWDGATYLSGGLGPLTVYTLFVQATNYPIGAATPSP